MKHIFLSIAAFLFIAGCSSPNKEWEVNVGIEPSKDGKSVRSKRDQILDSILKDVAQNPELGLIREAYATRENLRILLVDSKIRLGDQLFYESVPWPHDYDPVVPGYEVTRKVKSRKTDPLGRRRLGVTIHKFDLDRLEVWAFDTPIVVSVFCGDEQGDMEEMVIGGCSLYYLPEKVGGRWIARLVSFRG